MGSEEEAPLSVFITGFGKFIGVPYNPTETIVNNLKPFMRVNGMPKELAIGGCQVLVAAGKGALGPLNDFFKSAVEGKEGDPSKLSRTLLIHFGVSSAATKFVIESQAINEANFVLEDQLGWLPLNESIIKEDGGIEQIRQTSLPINEIADEMEKMGFPVVVSKNAGRFVCNYVYYNSLRFADGNGIKSLFVHVPLFNRIDEATQMLFVSSLLTVIASRYA